MTFKYDLNKFAVKVEMRSARVMRGTALDLFGMIVEKTPVGNPSLWISKPPKGYTGGRLRGNWQLSINSPASGTFKAIDKTGVRVNAKAHGNVKVADIGDSIWITNNLPYAIEVENGHSTQAPAGMVKTTLLSFKRHVDKNARKESRK